MIKFYRIRDPDTKEIIQELSAIGPMCYGQLIGLCNAMCGGCTDCLVMQARYYGDIVEVIDDNEG